MSRKVVDLILEDLDDYDFDVLNNYINELEKALQKVLDDNEIGVVPRSHLDHIQKLLVWRGSL